VVSANETEPTVAARMGLRDSEMAVRKRFNVDGREHGTGSADR